ncbi:DDE-type integrase/transposase/recombinase [Cyanobacteria bacterium FACHB-502]|nr:DDE-type integrase/transposase/recombinase [Cyanobacteria bacterium FACHB-502]
MRSRDSKVATRFFRKVLKATHPQTPRVITVDNNAAYPGAVEALKGDETLTAKTELRQSKYLNNIIEQAHRNIKRLSQPMMRFGSFNTARRTLNGIEAMSLIRKEQVKGISKGDSAAQVKLIEALFGISA